MSQSKDSRGILRGRCTAGGCDCIGYDCKRDSFKCTICGHQPGRHLKVETPVAVDDSDRGKVVGILAWIL